MIKQELLELFESSEKNLTHTQKMGRASTIARGLPYYGCLKNLFPIHFNSFRCIHGRTKDVSKEFERTVYGLINFIVYIGAVPTDLVKPTVGRHDHSIGYHPGNFSWQDKSDNCRERCIRLPTNTEHTRSYKQHTILKDYLLTLQKGHIIDLNYKFQQQFGYTRPQELRRALRRTGLCCILKNSTAIVS